MSENWVLTTPAPPGVREAYGAAPSQHILASPTAGE